MGGYTIHQNIDLAQIFQTQRKPSSGKTQSNINIGQALTQSNKPHKAENKPLIVARQEATYRGNKGTMVQYDDGSYAFFSTKTVGNDKVPYQYKFKNEKELKKDKPSTYVLNPGNNKKQQTTTLEYHRNGKVKKAEIYNAKNVRIREDKYNKDGRIEQSNSFNTKGELQKTLKYDQHKDNTADVTCYDKNKKLEYTGHIQYAKDGKTKISEEQRYPSGELKSETEFYDNGVIKEQQQYDKNGKITQKITSEIDGTFDNSRQAKEGDCYLMATINAIRETSGGQELLKNLVKISTNDKGEKVYTVTLPGAIAAGEGLKTDNRIDPNKMYITGEYTFTESEMQEILKQAGIKYSIGDGDVILLEAAFEKYRREAERTMKENGMDPSKISYLGQAGLQTGSKTENILAGGRSEDASFMLTGRQSQMYYDRDIQYGVNYMAMASGKLEVVPKPNTGLVATKAVSEIEGKVTNSQKELNNMLDKLMNDSKDGTIDYVATVGFMTINPPEKPGGHALTVKSVTSDTVTMINPWYPDKEVTMSREDFLKCARSLSITDLNKSQVPEAQVHQNQHQTGLTPQQIQQALQQNPHPQPAGQNSQAQQIAQQVQQTVQNGSQNQQTQQISQQIQQTVQQQTQQAHNYSVKRGDNMWKIAKQQLGPKATNAQVSDYVQKLIAANPQISNPNVIHVGQNIILP